MGSILLSQKKNDLAIESYKKALDICPDLEASQCALGLIYSDSGDMVSAAIHFKEAVRINPRSHNYRYHLGATLGRLQKPDEALIHLKEAVARNFNSAQYRYTLAIALFQVGRFEEALNELRIALSLAKRTNNRELGAKINSLGARISNEMKNRNH